MGALKDVIILLVSFSIVCHCGGVGGKNLSDVEDLELERQLQILNKTPIKTFQIENDVYDCIDIYKQPAFDHPLLKNHKIQMRPTYKPKSSFDQASSMPNVSAATLMGVSCPRGTVPIRRTQKADLIRARTFPRYHTTGILYPPGEHIVAVKSAARSLTYYGGHAIIAVYSLDVQDDQYSTAQMWVEGGSGDQYTSLQTGWMVSPSINKNKDTRLFIYWTPDNSKTGCYNHLCPGFVQVDPSVGPTSRLETSTDQEQKILDIEIFQDTTSGHWWLSFNGKTHVGYWPNSLLPQLQNGASLVSWGGLAAGPPNGDSPPMGNGQYPHGDYKKSCYMSHLETIAALGGHDTPDEHGMESIIDDPKCYGVEYYGYDKDKGLSFLFGGAGGKCAVKS